MIVGPPDETWSGKCAYEPPGTPRCGAPATRHILVLTSGASDGYAMLASCDAHIGIARSGENVEMEHAYRGWCGFPGTRWSMDDNACYLDDSGVELEVRALAEAGV
jgi:hypothetical protein